MLWFSYTIFKWMERKFLYSNWPHRDLFDLSQKSHLKSSCYFTNKILNIWLRRFYVSRGLAFKRGQSISFLTGSWFVKTSFFKWIPNFQHAHKSKLLKTKSQESISQTWDSNILRMKRNFLYTSILTRLGQFQQNFSVPYIPNFKQISSCQSLWYFQLWLTPPWTMSIII